MNLRVLVVDDEGVARRRLIRLLGRLEDITVAGEAADAEEALARMTEVEPDVALLDIRMPGMDGLELARALPTDTHVIFTTAYEEYALQAFGASAVDYLLKPIELERLEKALEKVRKLETPPERQDLEDLLDRLTDRSGPPRVAARRGDTLQFFDPQEISRFHAEAGYTVFRHGGRDYSLDDSIVALESRLRPWGFLKVHRAEIINLSHIRALRKEDDATLVELSGGERAQVSRRHLRALKKALGIAGG